jgi:hypothetical protein
VPVAIPGTIDGDVVLAQSNRTLGITSGGRRMYWRAVTLAVAAVVIATGLTAGLVFAKRTNDDLRHAQKVKSLPYSSAGVDTTNMTMEESEVITGCVFAFGSTLAQSVWYELKIGNDEAGGYLISTTGSTYDTVVAVDEAPSERRTLDRSDQVACGDDSGGTRQTVLFVGLGPGRYFVQIADYDTPNFEQPHSLDVSIERLFVAD